MRCWRGSRSTGSETGESKVSKADRAAPGWGGGIQAHKLKLHVQLVPPTDLLASVSQNVFVQSVNGRFRDECLNEEVSTSLADARSIIERWRQDSNQVRPHSAQGGLTPQAAHKRSAGD